MTDFDARLAAPDACCCCDCPDCPCACEGGPEVGPCCGGGCACD